MHCRHACVTRTFAVVRWSRQRRAAARSLNRACSSAANANMHSKKVVVIGAGFAGISAARTLIAEAKVPIEVVVLEAGDRVGGRACTAGVINVAQSELLFRFRKGSARSALMQVPGCGRVELGATWFHGIHGNPLYEHAVQLGLMQRETSDQSGKSGLLAALP